MNLDKSNNSLKYPLFLGGLTAAAGLGYLYYRSVQNKGVSDFELSRQQVIAILKEYRKDFYPIFKYLSNLSLTLQHDYKKKFNYIPDTVRQNLHSMLIDENPAFKEQVYAMEDRVYSKFAIHNRSGFEAYVLKLAKTDADVQALVTEIKNDFRKAVLGQQTSEGIDLPDIVNPEFILTIYKDSLKLILNKLISFVIEHKEKHGEISSYDDAFAMQLKDLNLEKLKLDLLEQRGLANYEDYHPERIFHHALTKYSKEDASFKDRMLKVEVFHQGLMQKIFGPNSDNESLLRELDTIDKLIEPEVLIIKEEKDELEDVPEVKEDWVDVQDDEPVVIEIEDPAEPENHITIEAQGNDVIITERTADEDIDTTKVTHLINNEVVEQIEEINIHPADTPNDDTFIHAPEDLDISKSTEIKNFTTEPQEIQTTTFTETKRDEEETVDENKDKDFLIANAPDVELVISHNEAPPAEVTSQDFVKTGEPVFEEIESNDFEKNEPELKPISVSVPELDEHNDTDKPRLNLDE